jgi:HD-GYP domain-containing protein (c-di-GMP phosphodiesterase class II)
MLSTTNLLRATGMDSSTVMQVVTSQGQLSSKDEAMLRWLTQGSGSRLRPARRDTEDAASDIRLGEHERQLRNLNWKVKAISAKLSGAAAQAAPLPAARPAALSRMPSPRPLPLAPEAAREFAPARALGLVVSSTTVRQRAEFPEWLHVKLSQGASQAYITSLPGARSTVRVVDTAATASAQVLSRVDYRRYEILRDDAPDPVVVRVPATQQLFQTGLSQGLIVTPRALQPKTFSEAAKEARSRLAEPTERQSSLRPVSALRTHLHAPVEGSRAVAASLGGTAGKRDDEPGAGIAQGWSGRGRVQASLDNGRTVTAQIPVYQPLLDELADPPERQRGGRGQRNGRDQPEPEGPSGADVTHSFGQQRALQSLRLALRLQQPPQGKQLGEFMSRHLSQTIGSLLKKAYNLDSINELSQEEAVNCLGLILKLGGDFTFSHSARVLDFALELADEMQIEDEQTREELRLGALLKDMGEMGVTLGLAPEEKQSEIAGWLSSQDMRQAGLLHDIGKVKIPPEILYKPGKLTEEEYQMMKLHPVFGEEMVYPIESLRHLCPVIRGHHERWDGKGYPDGLQAEQIPLAARIIAVADVYDALAAERPYKAGMPVAKVQAILREGRGTHFDPDLIDAFERVLQRRYPELANPFD